jgi:hypothetical protein
MPLVFDDAEIADWAIGSFYLFGDQGVGKTTLCAAATSAPFRGGRALYADLESGAGAVKKIAGVRDKTKITNMADLDEAIALLRASLKKPKPYTVAVFDGMDWFYRKTVVETHAGTVRARTAQKRSDPRSAHGVAVEALTERLHQIHELSEKD